MSAPVQVSRPSGPRIVRRRQRLTRRGKIVFSLLGVATIALVVLPLMRRPEVVLGGLDERHLLGAADFPVTISIAVNREVESIVAWLDEQTISVTRIGLGAEIDMTSAADGEHVLRVVVDRGTLTPVVALERSFTVDTTPPSVRVVNPSGPVPVVGPVEVRVSVDDPESTVTIAGTSVTAGEDGSFGLEFPNPPEAPVSVTAVDAAGNAVATEVGFQVDLPGNPGSDPIRGVHASGYTWSTAALKDPIMAMIASGQINTIEIDLKDEAGQVWWGTSVPLASEIGAVEELWNLSEVVRELHSLGVRVIGRLVVFRDPILADWAVERGNMDWIVQNPDGTPYGQYGGYTNPFSREVWEYNIAIGEEAARLGVDDILYDYVRRPDAFMDELRFPLQGEATPDDTIVAFLEESEPRIHAAGARLGASVFGIAATHPDQIAQPIPRIAQTVDYVAPMVYPSHWGPNEHGV